LSSRSGTDLVLGGLHALTRWVASRKE